MSAPSEILSPDGERVKIARNYVLLLLTVTYSLSVLDRFLLGILLPQIKAELQLSDSYLGLLSGIAFALFYATLGLPIARLADRYGRKYVIAASLALFSLMTMLCGSAVSFMTLFLARVGVGVGEAGTTPASLSVLSDLYEKQRRSTAMAIFSVGANVGLLIGFLVGGYVAVEYGWRQAFWIVGLPGIIVAIIIALTLKEPPRGYADGLANKDQEHNTIAGKPAGTGFLPTVKFLLSQKSYRRNVLGLSMMLFVGTGVIAWLPSFLARSHGMQADEVGLTLGLALGLAGPIGTIVLGGLVADRLSKRDLRWGGWVIGLGALLLIPAYLFVIYAPSGTLAVAAFFIPATLGVFYQGPTVAMTQAAAPVSMRATAGALMLLIGNLIGLGLGPLGIGMLSDWLEPRFGVDSLRYALLLAPVGALAGAAWYFSATRTLTADIERAERFT
jgi:MFS family permease